MATLMRLGWGSDDPAFRQLFTRASCPEGTKEQVDAFNALQRRTTSPNAPSATSRRATSNRRASRQSDCADPGDACAGGSHASVRRRASDGRRHPRCPFRRVAGQQSHAAARRTGSGSLHRRNGTLPEPLTGPCWPRGGCKGLAQVVRAGRAPKPVNLAQDCHHPDVATLGEGGTLGLASLPQGSHSRPHTTLPSGWAPSEGGHGPSKGALHRKVAPFEGGWPPSGDECP